MRKFWTSFSRFPGHTEKEQELSQKIDYDNLPQHIAIIMDGNGRWAQKRGLPRTAGHKYGVEALRKVLEACVELKIKILTIYAFSTENWKRPRVEVDTLMNLLSEYLRKEIKQIHAQNIRIRSIGNIEVLPETARKELENSESLTINNSGLILNIALNYGGRMEIVDAVKAIGARIKNKELAPAEITEEVFANHLYTAGQPDPDILIRPSGELRISNFLLWQLAYTELWYTDICWPDFNKNELLKAIYDFQNRNRRYGGLQK